MKNFYIIHFFIFFSFFSFSQEKNCGTEFSEKYVTYLNKNKKKIETLEKQFILNKKTKKSIVLNSIPVKIHIIRTSSGTGGILESNIKHALEIVNNNFKNAGLVFFICGKVNYINDSKFYNFESKDESELTSSNNIPNAINIYFTNTISIYTNKVCGYAYYPGGPETILMTNGCTNNGSTLSHEIGHFFGLIHTHGRSNSILTSELVNGTNCSIAGDYICDTPADPNLYSNVSNSCFYTGNLVDANSDPFNPNPKNIMSYSTKNCRTEFSEQQYARINAVYQLHRTNLNCSNLKVDFSADVTETCENAYLKVNFTDKSVGATLWEWDMNNDGIIDYTSKNPTHTFNSKGKYNVALTISNGDQKISKNKNSYIKVGAEEVNTSSIDLTINFNDYPSKISWSFYDENNTILESGGNYSDIEYGNKSIEKRINLTPNRCYRFEFYRSDNYDICCYNNTGDYTIKTSDGIQIASGLISGFKTTENIYTGKHIISDSFNLNDFKLVPNPISGSILNIVTSSNIIPDSIEVYNILGQEVFSKKTATIEDLKINISSIQNGVYYLKIKKSGKHKVINFIKTSN